MSNVSANTTMIAARIPKADAAALKIAAPARGLTYTQAVRQAIRDWLSPQIEAPDPVQDAKPVTLTAKRSGGTSRGRTGSAHLPTGAIPPPFEGHPMMETNITVDDAELARIRAKIAARPTDFPARPLGLKPVKPKGRKA